MELDVVIDVVCPWCFVGKRQLDKALAQRPGIVKQVRYRPYQLSAETPAEGVDRAEHYARKFGDSPQYKAAREHLLLLGKELGINFDFESECRIANTLDAHRMIRWAMTPGLQEEVAEGLMKAYFEDCAFLGDHALLVQIARDAGMDGDLVQDLLSSDQDKNLIASEVRQAHQMGIQGVPMFIFNGNAGVSGAQDASVLVQVIDKLQAAA
ncbi:MAG: DsbA family oxidoreductase [Kordiimonadaceae bacterium]|nr:DsbA family oxidoreductase [Kordiimonadaceae bacterium]MBO6570517.1 DsbA family oxidoreductase [Kordiimonadaceae bacterium]MBO6966364.1 DsbA family oxidoreductase [Kordiimonadaceae bacterium]